MQAGLGGKSCFSHTNAPNFRQPLKSLLLRYRQCAKKVVSDGPGIVDFAIGLVNSVFNLPNGQVRFFEEFE